MDLKLNRKAIPAAVIACFLLAAGICAGILAAGPAGRSRHVSFERAFNHVARRLELSNAQRNAIKKILRNHETEILAQIKAWQTARQDLHTAVMAGALDETAVRGRAAALGRAEGDGAVLRARIREEVWPILTAAQRQKVEEMGRKVEHGGEAMADSFKRFVENGN